MAKTNVAGASNNNGNKGKKPTAASTKKAVVAAQLERVVLNVEVKKTTRAGLNRLKSLLGMPNQGAVLDKLIRDGLAAAKAR